MKHKLLIIALMLSANLIFGADAAGCVQDALPKDYTVTVQPKKLDKINDSYVKHLLENVEQYRLAHLSDTDRDVKIYEIHKGNFENLMTPTLQDDMNNLGFMSYQNQVGYNICNWGTFGDFLDYAHQAYEKSLEVIHRVDHVLKDGIEKLSIPQERKKNMFEAIDSDTELKRTELYNSFIGVRTAFDSLFFYFDNMLSLDKAYMCSKQAMHNAKMVHPFNGLLETLGVDPKKYQAAADKTQFMLNMIPSLLELDDQKGDEKLQRIEDFLKKKETFELILFSQLSYLPQEDIDDILQQHNQLYRMLNSPFVR